MHNLKIPDRKNHVHIKRYMQNLVKNYGYSYSHLINIKRVALCIEQYPNLAYVPRISFLQLLSALPYIMKKLKSDKDLWSVPLWKQINIQGFGGVAAVPMNTNSNSKQIEWEKKLGADKAEDGEVQFPFINDPAKLALGYPQDDQEIIDEMLEEQGEEEDRKAEENPDEEKGEDLDDLDEDYADDLDEDIDIMDADFE